MLNDLLTLGEAMENGSLHFACSPTSLTDERACGMRRPPSLSLLTHLRLCHSDSASSSIVFHYPLSHLRERKMRGCFLVLIVIQTAFAATCFLSETSTTPYVTMSVTIEQSIKWCYTACDDTPGCTSVVYDNKDGSCVKLSASPVLNPLVCQAPYTRHYMTEAGCPYGDPMANMGTDPCARLMPFLLDYQVEGTNKVCPQRKCDGTSGPPIIVRYRDESGNLQTMDNCNNNKLNYDAATGKWELSYSDKYGNFSVIATAVACAEITNAAACPCPPIVEYSEPNLNPKGPMLLNTIPACPPPYYPKVIVKNAKTGTRTLEDPNTFIAICMGGSWMACGSGASSYTAMKIGGCGTP